MENVFDKLPKPFLKRIKEQLSDEQFDNYKLGMNQPAVRGVRINKKRIKITEFLKNSNLNLKKLEFCDDGFILNSDEKIGNTPEHLSGVIYLQEPSSMLAVCASKIEQENRHLRVLDLCAAPGGKSSQIASRISEDSVLYSNEIIKSRAQILFSNIERQGFKNVIILNEEPKNLINFEGFFDYVFVDAPCSGEGMFRKNPETINEWSEETVLMCANRQKEILDIATKLVSENGKLIYSTCTYSLEEDEEIVEWLEKTKNFKLVDIDENIKKITVSSLSKVENKEFARKIYSISQNGEGQFVAVFQNLNECENNVVSKKKYFDSIKEVGKTEKTYLKEFFNNSLKIDLFQTVVRVGENLYLPPKSFKIEEQIKLDSLKFVSIGVKIGSIQKGRFEPHHNLFMAYFDEFKIKFELTDNDLVKYLHGEEVMTDITSQNKAIYVVLTKNGLPVGGGKLVGNRIKNLYPKGMRV